MYTNSIYDNSTSETVTETVEVIEYNADGKMVRKTVTTTSKSAPKYRSNPYGPFWYSVSGSTTGNYAGKPLAETLIA